MEHFIIVCLSAFVLILSLLSYTQHKLIKQIRKVHQQLAEMYNHDTGYYTDNLNKKNDIIASLTEALDAFKKAPPSVAKSYNQPKPRHRISLKQKAVILKQYAKCVEADIPLENLVAGLNREFGCNKSYRAYENVWRSHGKLE